MVVLAVRSFTKPGSCLRSFDSTSAATKWVRGIITDEKNWFLKAIHLRRCLRFSEWSPLCRYVVGGVAHIFVVYAGVAFLEYASLLVAPHVLVPLHLYCMATLGGITLSMRCCTTSIFTTYDPCGRV